MLTVKDLEQAESLQTIIFPLVVPSDEEVLNSKDLDLSKSSLNACYSKQKKNGKKQSWFDVQLIVEGEHDLPPREEWFYIVTDDGYLFKARFAGKKTKRLSTFEDTEIIGEWIKGRLAESGFVFGFDYVYKDIRKEGIITKEILEGYGGDQVLLKKTNRTRKDGKGTERDVWFLSFPFDLDY